VQDENVLLHTDKHTQTAFIFCGVGLFSLSFTRAKKRDKIVLGNETEFSISATLSLLTAMLTVNQLIIF